MKSFVSYSFSFRRNILVLMEVSLSLYFVYHTVSGARSYAYLQAIQGRVVQERAAYKAVSAKRAELEKRVVMMRPGTLSRDLLEERVRLVLGYKRSDELVVFGN